MDILQDSPAAAIRRHLLDQSEPRDRDILIGLIDAKLGPRELPTRIVNAELRQKFGCSETASAIHVLEAAYGGKLPYAAYAAALALDAIDGTPDTWTQALDPEERFEPAEDLTYRDDYEDDD